jgi:gliding motility-associated-like protein
VQLVLAINPADTVQLTQEICAGSAFIVGNQSFTPSGNYQVMLMNQLGCDSLVNLSLVVNELDTTQLQSNLCSGQSIVVGNQTFTTTGTYQVMLQNASGCDSLVVLRILVDDAIRVQVNPVICEGQSYLLPDGNLVTQSGVYIDTLTASAGCDSIITTVLTVRLKPDFGLEAYQQACIGATVRALVPVGAVVTWSGPNGFSSTGAALIVPDLGSLEVANFIVTVSLPDACTYTDTIQIDTRLCDLIIPQGLSPNADGINDQFVIRGLENYPNNTIKIFNRAGSLVYDAAPYANDFMGVANRNLQGELLQGTYFYMLDLGDGQKVITGYVYLSR